MVECQRVIDGTKGNWFAVWHGYLHANGDAIAGEYLRLCVTNEYLSRKRAAKEDYHAIANVRNYRMRYEIS